ncbi:MAG TPA: redoxin domain-containing protein [Clostridiaceae bacterium]|nr:redoxin domain-containing protein [Clostridiaceae bacterium]
MDLIKAGDVAPDFTLKDNLENDVKLSGFKGKKVLLSWHPLAWTSVCMDQMRSLERNMEAFRKLNAIPLGLSVDPQPSKQIWADVLKLEELKILADFWPHGKTAMDYGLFIEEYGISQRANVIVDEKGVVRWVKVYPMSQLPDIDEVLKVLSEI